LEEAVRALQLQALPAERRIGAVGGDTLGFSPDYFAMIPESSRNLPPSEGEVMEMQSLVALMIGHAIARADGALRELANRIVYLGPFRQSPDRLVLLTGERFTDVGTAGENTIALLARSELLRNQVNTWLERLDIPYALAIDPLETTREMLGDVIVAGLQERESKTAVSIRDVGFGVSQVLPVVVQSVAADGRLVAIEQPELHLHPRLQAQLGDLFCERANAGTSFLLETHSEHLILRLLRLVREGNLAPEKLAVVYVDRDEDYSSILHRLRVAADGEFVDRWPRGFFPERRDELRF
jgi:hypothetical protein